MAIVDSVVNAVKDAFFGGPQTWRERLQGQITLVSPDGNQFTAKWIGDNTTLPKKIGQLSPPKVKGDLAQDLGNKSELYSTTFYFTGDNNDTEALAFMAATKEKGTWEITHPVHGFHTFQLISVTKNDQPVENGGITEITADWFEPIDPLELKTARELAGIIDGKANDLNITAAQQFANNLLTASETLRSSIEQTTTGIQRVTDLALGPLFTSVDALDNAVNSIQQGITDTNNATVLQVNALAGQIQNLINLPLFANSKLEDRITAYSQTIAGLSQQLPGGDDSLLSDTASSDAKKNSIATLELGLTAALGSLANIVTTTAISPNGLGPDDSGALATKAQAIQAIEDLTTQFNDTVDALDGAMDLFDTEDIDKQYFSQSEAYNDLALLMYLATEYLLSIIFDLALERRFTLDRPRTPIEVVITEYGSTGENDLFLDLFIYSNNLIGKEIVLLPRGKEVVVYV